MYKNFKKDDLYKYKEAFNIFDVRQTGSISVEDLPSLLAILHVSPTRKELKSLNDEYSGTHDNKIRYKDFLSIMQRMRNRTDDKRTLLEAFENLMEKPENHIPTDKLREVLCNKGEVLSNEEFDLLASEADPKRTGRIDYKAFVELLLA